MRYPCVFLEPINELRLFAYISEESGECPGNFRHRASTFHSDVPLQYEEDGRGYKVPITPQELGNQYWKECCECGYKFTDKAYKSIHPEHLHLNLYTNEKLVPRDFPIGALYPSWWDSKWKGPDGLTIICRMPKGEWTIDSRANNCTLPEDDVHRCWVRHGDVRDPLGLHNGGIKFHVDKNGNTCQAGAGSILMHDGWHGWLHDGHLKDDAG